MKNTRLVILFLLIFSLNKVLACEVCGCGTGNFYLGMIPKFNSKFIGVRYRSLYFETQLKDDPSQYSTDYYETLEIWSGWNLGKKWQLMTFIPYQINYRVTDDGTKSSRGLGDITVLANYKVWNNGVSLLSHQLWVGGGIKLPTGHYMVDFNNPGNNLGDPNGQTGTGSVDVLFNLNHSMTYGNWGLNTTLNYKYNSANPDQFKFGNRFSANMLGYHRFKVNSFNLAPAFGAVYEHLKSNSYQNTELSVSGGYAIFASAGLEMNYRKIAFGITLQSPVGQNFSEHQTTVKTRALTHLTFTF